MSPAIATSQTPEATQPKHQLDWHIVLDTSGDQQVTAWIAEWPDCRVVTTTKEEAIEAVKQALEEKLKASEVIPLSVQLPSPEHPVMKFVGILKDDPKFIAWSDAFWAEKQRNHDDEEILSLEEFLQES